MAVAPWPMVGRTAELSKVRARLRAGSSGVVLAGPAGLGKTRLAIEALSVAPEYGFTTLRVSATQAAASLPLGAFAAFLPELVAGTERADMLQQTARAITDLGNGRPVAVLVDDAHLLDEASAALTHQLALGGNVFVLATIRSGEPTSDAIVALWKDGLAERVEVKPLTVDDVEELLVAVLGGPADHATARLLHDRTEGNVLYLRELIVAALDGGVLKEEGGLWRLSGPLPASDRLVELVEARLKGLGAADRQCVLALAIAEPLGLDLLRRVGGPGDVEGLERRGVVRVEEDGRRLDVRLGHPLYGEVLRARLSPLQNRALSRALADAVGAAGAARREDVLRLATWRLDGGGAGDTDLLVAGGRQAFARHDIPLAERLARAAWEGGGGFDAGLLLGLVLSNGGRVQEAERLFAMLVPMAGDDHQRSALAEARIDNHAMTRRYDLALAVAEEAEAAITDLTARAAVGSQRARILIFTGRRPEAARLAEAMLPHAVGKNQAMAALIVSGSRAVEGQLSDAIEISRVGIAADLSHDPMPRWVPSLVRYNYIRMLAAFGSLAESEAFATDAYATAVDEKNRLAQGHVAAGMAVTCMAQGRVATGATWARLSERLLREDGRTADRGYPLVYLALASALLGSLDAARAALTEYESLPGWEDPQMVAEALQARAWAAVAGGDLPAGRRLLGEAVRLAHERKTRVLESVVLHDLARLGRPADAAARLQELRGIVDGPLAAARAAHAEALLSADPAGLDAAARAFEDIGALLLAAEAANEAAVAWRRSGDLRKATAAERRAGALSARCEGATTPGLAVASGARAALTDRELEIARLAAAGVSNREIAARLFLSLHTVENKLHIAYEKLGIKGRRELASALRGT